MELNTGITALRIQLWKHYDSAHTHAGTHTYTYTPMRTHTQPLYRPLLLHYPEGAPLCNFICKKPAARVAFKTPSPIHRASKGRRLVRIRCMALATHAQSMRLMLPSPVFSTSQIGVNSWQNTALSGALSFPPQSLLTQPSAGCLQEAHFQVRTQSAHPARHGPCSKAGKTLRNPRRAPHAHLHLAGASGWVGSGRDPRLNSSCYSVCEY